MRNLSLKIRILLVVLITITSHFAAVADDGNVNQCAIPSQNSVDPTECPSPEDASQNLCTANEIKTNANSTSTQTLSHCSMQDTIGSALANGSKHSKDPKDFTNSMGTLSLKPSTKDGELLITVTNNNPTKKKISCNAEVLPIYIEGKDKTQRIFANRKRFVWEDLPYGKDETQKLIVPFTSTPKKPWTESQLDEIVVPNFNCWDPETLLGAFDKDEVMNLEEPRSISEQFHREVDTINIAKYPDGKKSLEVARIRVIPTDDEGGEFWIYIKNTMKFPNKVKKGATLKIGTTEITYDETGQYQVSPEGYRMTLPDPNDSSVQPRKIDDDGDIDLTTGVACEGIIKGYDSVGKLLSKTPFNRCNFTENRDIPPGVTASAAVAFTMVQKLFKDPGKLLATSGAKQTIVDAIPGPPEQNGDNPVPGKKKSKLDPQHMKDAVIFRLDRSTHCYLIYTRRNDDKDLCPLEEKKPAQLPSQIKQTSKGGPAKAITTDAQKALAPAAKTAVAAPLPPAPTLPAPPQQK